MSMERTGLETLREEVFAGQLSRRLVLKRAMALGLSAPIIAGLLAACGDDEDEPAEAEATSPGSAGDATEPADAEATEPAASGDATEPADAEATEPAASGSGGERGGGGQIRLMYWQAPTLMNPHLTSGTKDYHASRVCLEPLFEFDDDLNPMFYLAVEPYPSVENGMLAEDGTSVTWNLRQGVK